MLLVPLHSLCRPGRCQLPQWTWRGEWRMCITGSTAEPEPPPPRNKPLCCASRTDSLSHCCLISSADESWTPWGLSDHRPLLRGPVQSSSNSWVPNVISAVLPHSGFRARSFSVSVWKPWQRFVYCFYSLLNFKRRDKQQLFSAPLFSWQGFLGTLKQQINQRVSIFTICLSCHI